MIGNWHVTDFQSRVNKRSGVTPVLGPPQRSRTNLPPYSTPSALGTLTHTRQDWSPASRMSLLLAHCLNRIPAPDIEPISMRIIRKSAPALTVRATTHSLHDKPAIAL